MNPTQLGADIRDALGFSSKPVSAQLAGMAANIVTHEKTGVVSFAPGGVTGTAPPSGGPLTLGAANGGIVLLVPSALEALFTTTFGGSTSQTNGMAIAMSTHFQTALAAFATGGITGACANTPTSPGPLVGAGANGTLSGLDGSALASAVATAIGQASPSSQLSDMCDVIVNHIMDNGAVTLPPASVVGVCSAGGGPVTLGAATGGLIL
jgi:hypothetical protein